MNWNIEQIKDDFIKVIEYSQGIVDPKVDRLFDIWLTSKSQIIKAFGDELIYEVPEKVVFELDENSKKDRVQNLINICWDLGLNDLSDFIECEQEGFFKNICEVDFRGKVFKGAKLVKAFKHFVDDPEILHEMQSRASQIIQENKIEGTICFSVHPLDYLSISENAHNWRSCHALDGEYRAGNLSYMMDSSTIVCYLKGDEEVKLPRFPEGVPWNSKKWRVLLYLSNNWEMVMAGKQYPFANQRGMDLILEKCFNYGEENNKFRKPDVYKAKYNGNYWSPWSDYKLPIIKNNGVIFDYSLEHYIPLHNEVVKIVDLVKDEPGSKQFNDVLKSSCYEPMYTYLVEKGWWNDKLYCVPSSTDTRFNIGAYTYCLRCGNEEVMDCGSGTMLCYNCERDYGNAENEYFCFCAECGERIETERSFYMEDNVYCEECFTKTGERCCDCGDYYLRENMIYNEVEDAYYCEWCSRNR